MDEQFFNKDEVLRPEIRKVLLRIYADVINAVKEKDIEFSPDDFVITGSLTGNDYTEDSDVDLHIIVDYSAYEEPELAKAYFYDYGKIWTSHEYELLGRKIELYFQDKDEPHISPGIYSVINNVWVYLNPHPDIEISEEAEEKAEDIKESLLKSMDEAKDDEDVEKLKDEVKAIKENRRKGLIKNGMDCIENQVFHILKNEGIFDEIYDKIDKLEVNKYNIVETTCSFAVGAYEVPLGANVALDRKKKTKKNKKGKKWALQSR